jgi:hypothetical protein
MSDDLLPQTSGVNPPPTPAEPIIIPFPSVNGGAAPVEGTVDGASDGASDGAGSAPRLTGSVPPVRSRRPPTTASPTTVCPTAVHSTRVTMSALP